VDSVLIAHLIQEMGMPFTCYAAGRDTDAPDLAWAEETAKEFGFPIQTASLSLGDIENLIPEIIRDIEDYSLNQVEVAVPIYAAVRMAQEAGERVILNGQGADELFGGYAWYSTIVEQEGYDNFVQRSWEDACLLYKECLEREDKIAMAHSIELRVPFLDPEVFRVAFTIAPELKITNGDDALRKFVHREYCRRLGIPGKVANRSKEAAQHGANVHDAFEELAEKSGLTEELMNDIGYDPEKTVTEKLGSSSRYGFRYGDHDLWKPLPQVQFYLDSIAHRLNLLAPAARIHIEQVCREPSMETHELLEGIRS
jgi:asparagine synthase (glutamine-hydrolysing)